MLEDLLTQLEKDNPGEAEPVLGELSRHLGVGELRPINNALEMFDFQDAKNETRILAKRLDLKLGEA